jgi:hypothetical protein
MASASKGLPSPEHTNLAEDKGHEKQRAQEAESLLNYIHLLWAPSKTQAGYGF